MVTKSKVRALLGVVVFNNIKFGYNGQLSTLRISPNLVRLVLTSRKRPGMRSMISFGFETLDKQH